MFYKISDFLTDFNEETSNTIKLLSNLTDESLSQKVHSEGRSLGKLAWHLVECQSEMMNHAKLNLSKIDENAVPKIANVILENYKMISEEVKNQVSKNWDDSQLADELNMYGQSWSKGLTLRILINHEIHHRGQITVLMRQAGLKVPGIYGPSQEEWSVYGMEPHE